MDPRTFLPVDPLLGMGMFDQAGQGQGGNSLGGPSSSRPSAHLHPHQLHPHQQVSHSHLHSLQMSQQPNFDTIYGEWVHTNPTPPPPASAGGSSGVDRGTIGHAVANLQHHQYQAGLKTQNLATPLVLHSATNGGGVPSYGLRPVQQQGHVHQGFHAQHHSGDVKPKLYASYGMDDDDYSSLGLGLPSPNPSSLAASSSSHHSQLAAYAEYRPLSGMNVTGSSIYSPNSHLAHYSPVPLASSSTSNLPSQDLFNSAAADRPIAGKPRRSLGNSFPSPMSSTFSTPLPSAPSASADAPVQPPRKSPRTPHQQQTSDESSVPEAALHLLRLALPSGSTGGSVTTNASVSTTAGGDDDASCDEDAEGESDATSIHSDDERGGRHGKRKSTSSTATTASGSKVSHEQTSRRTSVASSRGHRPARTQREMSTSTRAGSEGPAPARRTSGRVRKSVVPDTKTLFDSDSDEGRRYEGYSSGDEKLVNDGEQEDYLDNGDRRKSAPGSGSSKKGKGKAATGTPRSVSTASGKGKRPSLTGSETPSTTSTDAADPQAAKTRAPKKPRLSGPAAPRRPRRVAAPVTTGSRSFPPSVHINPSFPRLYRTFPLSTAFGPESYVNRLRSVSNDFAEGGSGQPPLGDKLPEIRNAGSDVVLMQPPEGSKWNKACDPFNLYAPRFTKGSADEKAGMCPICVEPVERGGEGVERWLKLKNSSYVYHMSYAHGLSNLTGLPFSPPITTRTEQLKPLTKDARDHMTQGLCHRCNNWIPLLSVKNVEAVVPELIWWKHAKPCHGNSSIPGEGDFYVEDDVFELVKSRKNAHSNAHPQHQHPVASTSAH
ncbi:hypothetical protein P7C70_g6518, partial [Phenoliferia sp. Uapishka_3]